MNTTQMIPLFKPLNLDLVFLTSSVIHTYKYIYIGGRGQTLFQISVEPDGSVIWQVFFFLKIK